MALTAFLLTFVGTLHLVGFLVITLERWNVLQISVNNVSIVDDDRWILLRQWCAYMTAICCFHLLEFFTTALFNPTQATAQSFLVNHSTTYTMAAITSWTEFWVRFWLGPSWNIWFLPWMGLLILIISQTIRSWAMVTAGESFNHIIQTRKKDNHILVTHGIYRFFRHPSYVGFFYWSISTQLILGNLLHIGLFTFASWRFFSRRIPYEEESLCLHFPNEYPQYVARTWMGIPFIQSIVGIDEKQKRN